MSNESNIGATGEHIAAAQQHLPFTSMDVATSHIEAAGAIVGEVSTDSTRMQEASAYISGAGENLSRASAAITAGHNALSAYTADIGVSSQPLRDTGDTIAPQHAASSEARSVYTPKLIIEERIVGDTAFKVVLCDHTAENAPAMAAAVADCDIVVIESPGNADEADRLLQGEQLTTIFTDLYNNDAVRDYLQKDLTDISKLYLQLLGSNKKAIMIDMTRDHPDWPLVQRFQDQLLELVQGVAEVEPPLVSRAKMASAGATYGDAITARDRVMAQQLAAIPGEVGHAKVGVIMGSLHHDAIRDLGDSDAADAARVKQLAHADVDGMSTLAIARQEGRPMDDILLNRAVLIGYMSYQNREDAHLIDRLSDEHVNRVIEYIDVVAASDDDVATKRKKMDIFMYNLAKMIGEGTL